MLILEMWIRNSVMRYSRKKQGHKLHIIYVVIQVKRFPYGIIQAFKAILCVRGDPNINVVDLFYTFAPVV